MKAELVRATLLPSRVASLSDPGHMSISFHGEGIEAVHRGFRFNIRDLPKPYRVPIRFREFLFENRVPGYVVDEFEFQAMTRRFPQECLSRVWSVASQEAVD